MHTQLELLFWLMLQQKQQPKQMCMRRAAPDSTSARCSPRKRTPVPLKMSLCSGRFVVCVCECVKVYIYLSSLCLMAAPPRPFASPKANRLSHAVCSRWRLSLSGHAAAAVHPLAQPGIETLAKIANSLLPRAF